MHSIIYGGLPPEGCPIMAPEFKAEIVELCQRGDRSAKAERDTGTRGDGGRTVSDNSGWIFASKGRDFESR
jgi:hypothetical protein